jgi:hypothetical protein
MELEFLSSKSMRLCEPSKGRFGKDSSSSAVKVHILELWVSTEAKMPCKAGPEA